MWAAKRPRKFVDSDDESFGDSDEVSYISPDISTGNSELSSNYEYDCDQNDETKANKDDENLIKNRLLKVLKNVTEVGATEFAISGILPDAPIHAISLKKSQKIIRFPLFEDDLPSIIEVFKQSPYGKGTETIVDASFRNSWHLDPHDFEIMNPKWGAYLTDVLSPRIQKEMAIATSFQASLYKLLLYKSGSFFKPHRDTEKEERMFATLVVQLPSRFNGGQLVVEHDNQTKKIDFSSKKEAGNDFSTFFSAFYCDCKHEILPVADGIRVCLVYNLIMNEVSTSSAVLPTAPIISAIEAQMGSICDDWRKTDEPTKIVYGLSHKYTERSISFQSLKSTDKAAAEMLVKLSKDHSLAVFLATLEKTWEGDECFLNDKYDDEVQIDYRLKHLEMIGAANINVPNFKTMSVDYDLEMIPKDCFRNLAPFDKQKEETGNEGTILTLSYRHSALVVFPVENVFNILIKEDKVDEAKPIFLDECKKFKKSGGNEDTEGKLIKWAHKLIPDSPWRREQISLPILSAIMTLGDLPLLQKYLENHILDAESIGPIVKLCDKFGWNALSEHLVKTFKKVKRENAVKMVDLIVGNPADFGGNVEKKNFCFRLMELIPTLSTESRHSTADFLYAFCVLAKRINYDPLKHLKLQSVDLMVSVLVKLAATTKNILDKFWMETAQHFLKKMKELDTKPDQNPVWIRNDSVACTCEDCAVLSRFMQTNEKSTTFKIIKKRRLHVEKVVNGVNNLTFTTDTSGRPATMVVSKTVPSSYTASQEQVVARKLLSKLTAILR